MDKNEIRKNEFNRLCENVRSKRKLKYQEQKKTKFNSVNFNSNFVPQDAKTMH